MKSVPLVNVTVSPTSTCVTVGLKAHGRRLTWVARSPWSRTASRSRGSTGRRPTRSGRRPARRAGCTTSGDQGQGSGEASTHGGHLQRFGRSPPLHRPAMRWFPAVTIDRDDRGSRRRAGSAGGRSIERRWRASSCSNAPRMSDPGRDRAPGGPPGPDPAHRLHRPVDAARGFPAGGPVRPARRPHAWCGWPSCAGPSTWSRHATPGACGRWSSRSWTGSRRASSTSAWSASTSTRSWRWGGRSWTPSHARSRRSATTC